MSIIPCIPCSLTYVLTQTLTYVLILSITYVLKPNSFVSAVWAGGGNTGPVAYLFRGRIPRGRNLDKHGAAEVKYIRKIPIFSTYR